MKITMEDVQDEIDYWSTAVVCCVMGSNPPKVVMEGFFKRIWKNKGMEKVALVNKGVFLVRFNSMEEREKIVEEGVLMFDKKTVVIRPWKADIDISKEGMDKVPIWVRLIGLDVKYWGLNALN